MAREVIASPTSWGLEVAKMNSNFTELYTNVGLLTDGSHGINIKYPPVPLIACVGNGVTDDSIAFTAALALAATQKCPLFVPSGTFLINGGNNLVRGVRIIGLSGYDSCLKMKNGQNVDFFVLANATDNLNAGAGMIGLRLDGNKANNTTAGWSVLRVGGVSEDTIFENMHLENGYNGLSVDGGTYQWQYRFRNFLIEQMTEYGLDGLGTDNTFSNFVIGPTGNHCVRAAGSNCRLDNFKIYGSTTGSGLYIGGSRLQFNNIDAQESYMHGVHIVEGYDIVFTNLNCDNNGFNWAEYVYGTPPPVKAVPDSYGVKIEAGLNVSILGYNFSNRNASYKYGVGAYWVGTGSYSSQKINIQLNDEKNPNSVSTDNSADGINLFNPNGGVSIEKTSSFTLAGTDIGKTIRLNSSSPITVTIPNDTTANAAGAPKRAIDTTFERYGTGTVTFAVEAGADLQAKALNISVQYGVAIASRTHANRWFIRGDLS